MSIVAKAMATHVLGMDVPDPVSLLSGRPFQQSGIGGVVESDFFDWVVGSERVGPKYGALPCRLDVLGLEM